MTGSDRGWSRRRFLKATGTAGLGALMAPASRFATAAETPTRVPTRPFGKTGVDVSILSLGGMFNIGSNQLMMKQAMRWGVTYWDTADCYQRGSEKGYREIFYKESPGSAQGLSGKQIRCLRSGWNDRSSEPLT